MKFKLPEDTDLIADLRALDDPAASAAAESLQTAWAAMADAADTLEAATRLKISIMDSDSRVQEIQTAIKLAMSTTVGNLRAKIPPPPALKAVI